MITQHFLLTWKLFRIWPKFSDRILMTQQYFLLVRSYFSYQCFHLCSLLYKTSVTTRFFNSIFYCFCPEKLWFHFYLYVFQKSVSYFEGFKVFGLAFICISGRFQLKSDRFLNRICEVLSKFLRTQLRFTGDSFRIFFCNAGFSVSDIIFHKAWGGCNEKTSNELIIVKPTAL